jgi:hypothetical protein
MPKKTKRTVRTRKGIREYTYLGCPLTKSRTAWCFRLCVPDANGKGQCGRVAPHSLLGRTQKAIEAHNRQKHQARIEALESAYLARPDLDGFDPGVGVSEGEAEVVLHPGGSDGITDPMCMTALHDSARLAVASMVRAGEPSTEEFSVKLSAIAGSTAVVARSLFVGMSDDRFLTESILSDGDGRELGRGSGVFSVEA